MKSEFIITEKAGFEVAGRRNPGVGEKLMLTDVQAEQPLRTGEIRRPTKEEKQEAKAAKSKAAEK